MTIIWSYKKHLKLCMFDFPTQQAALFVHTKQEQFMLETTRQAVETPKTPVQPSHLLSLL